VETGLNQNWNRDYDPMVGKYIESDPIGLKGGGFSTYSYVNSNPLSFIDSKGQGIEIAVPIVIVGYTCYELYCVKRGRDGCAKKYPAHANPMSSDNAKYGQCQKAIVTICASVGAFGYDPLAAASAEAGGHITEMPEEAK
jgi:uncharacterized protein RhaS with RHS repeats